MRFIFFSAFNPRLLFLSKIIYSSLIYFRKPFSFFSHFHPFSSNNLENQTIRFIFFSTFNLRLLFLSRIIYSSLICFQKPSSFFSHFHPFFKNNLENQFRISIPSIHRFQTLLFSLMVLSIW